MKFKIFKFKKINSTNDKAINMIKAKKEENGFICSLMQSKGRGRYGSNWKSLKGNFFGSFFFKYNDSYPKFEEFNFINIKLIINILKKYIKKNIITFKKPNDILINKKKICGILQEVVSKGENKYLIIGIGINLVSSPKIKNYQTTNIYHETNIKPDLDKFIFMVVKSYEKLISNIKTKNKKVLNINKRKLI